jgi:ribose 1,5-bisphosphokinase PhnN
MRASRQWLKAQQPEAVTLYRQLLAVELASEKLLLEKLESRFLRENLDEVCNRGEVLSTTECYLQLSGFCHTDKNKKRLATITASLWIRSFDSP